MNRQTGQAGQVPQISLEELLEELKDQLPSYNQATEAVTKAKDADIESQALDQSPPSYSQHLAFVSQNNAPTEQNDSNSNTNESLTLRETVLVIFALLLSMGMLIGFIFLLVYFAESISCLCEDED
ncbi:hypothetical protein BN7_2367 [Wickerhamomyces ciferrii]|uniref:Uncharacterized protein n=1 Tax=Wickerhamomyces ciferrii (strain ATCC 14091 / BCRC 22168 / CBS 111 / JCM 3599 / NBRC 0793 / NRRL Y-1031 F-60-10) TaxID=1206466 RepID=K0KKZ4_WICCF|nr:uncharacterized protein BN7_2367 [Wickerhamomyces ciferrii]CCH42822.1 hypothetical protein BN7_2367 [Wickerhamomyces ciferrii]